jgi:hypothetical protein
VQLEHQLHALLICQVEMVFNRQLRIIGVDDCVIALLEIYLCKSGTTISGFGPLTRILWRDTKQKQVRQLDCVDWARTTLDQEVT